MPMTTRVLSRRLGLEQSQWKDQADSTFLPRARRLFRTLRPPFVAILARNPWVRLRLITLGWNVRFMGARLDEVLRDAHSMWWRS